MAQNPSCPLHGDDATPGYAYHPDDTDEPSKAFFRGVKHGEAQLAEQVRDAATIAMENASLREQLAATQRELEPLRNVAKQMATALTRIAGWLISVRDQAGASSSIQEGIDITTTALATYRKP